jgi:hypothetical protein
MMLNTFLSLQIVDIKIRISEASIPGIIVAVYIFVRMCSREECLLASSCPPVLLSPYLCVSTSLTLDGFPLNFILNFFMKHQLGNSKFGHNLEKNIGHFYSMN